MDRKALEDKLAFVREERVKAQATAAEAARNVERCNGAEYILTEQLNELPQSEEKESIATDLAQARKRRS